MVVVVVVVVVVVMVVVVVDGVGCSIFCVSVCGGCGVGGCEIIGGGGVDCGCAGIGGAVGGIRSLWWWLWWWWWDRVFVVVVVLVVVLSHNNS